MNKVFVDLEYLCPSVSDKVDTIIKKILKERFNVQENQYSYDEEETLDYLEKYEKVKDLLFSSKNKRFSNILNYDELYSIENINTKRMEYVFNTYQDICFICYFNSVRELNAKTRLLSEFGENVTVLPIPYKMDERRVNKAKFIKEFCKLPELASCVLLDNSYTALVEWDREGGLIDTNSSEEAQLTQEEINSYVKKK